MTRWQSEEGTVTAMVAVLALALLACAGLAYDGGAIITATADARDLAAAAARTGAQQVDPAAVHAGLPNLDPVRAVDAAEMFLEQAGAAGTVSVDGATVTVTVRTAQPFRLLPLPDRQIAATATATAVSDVLGADP